jgi:alkaline phosphatase D
MTTIAFASCAHVRTRPDQPAWGRIAAVPGLELMLLLGDTAYMPGEFDSAWDHAELERQYKKQMAVPGFMPLMKQVPVLATWDDHDFGTNDACGAEHPTQRDKSVDLFQKYMSFIANPDKRKIYCSHVIGDVRVIVLEQRYHRQTVRALGDGSTLLGEEQEKWLFDELAKSTQTFTVICSGSTVDKGELALGVYSESLSHYEPFYGKLKAAVHKKGRVLLLSGDIHYNRFASHHIDAPDPAYPEDAKKTIKALAFHEATSSGVAQVVYRKVGGVDQRVEVDNWGLLTFGADEVTVQLNRNDGSKTHRIRVSDWGVV